MVLEIKGDIRETPIYTIAHGVNCQGVMGSGVARALFEKWPVVRSGYLEFHEKKGNGFYEKPEEFLGKNCYVYPTKEGTSLNYPIRLKEIVNMHTQVEFGPADKQYVDYAAVLECFNSLANDLSKYERTEAIAVPKIGSGLAGGDWDVIKKIMVESTQKKNIDLVIYSLK